MEDGGELIIRTGQETQSEINVSPAYGALVVFLNEDFPHAVLSANRERFSIAIWFRVNTSSVVSTNEWLAIHLLASVNFYH